MARRVVYSPAAQDDLLALRRYIAERGFPATALRYAEAIVSYCESFVLFPDRGTRRDDLRPGLKTVGFRREATIAFAVNNDQIVILRILYGGRDIDAAIRDMENPP